MIFISSLRIFGSKLQKESHGTHFSLEQVIVRVAPPRIQHLSVGIGSRGGLLKKLLCIRYTKPVASMDQHDVRFHSMYSADRPQTLECFVTEFL